MSDTVHTEKTKYTLIEKKNSNKHLSEDLGEHSKKLTEILKKLECKLNCNGVSIFLYNEENNTLELYVKTKKTKVVEREYDLNLYKNIRARVIENKDGLRINIIKDNINKKYTELRNYYVFSYAITCDDEFLGIINIYGDKQYYISEDIQDCFFDKIALMVKNRKLSVKLSKEVEKRIEIENELEMFLQTSTDLCGIIIKKNDCVKLVKTSKIWNQVLGCDEKELNDMQLNDLIHPDDLEKFNLSIDKARKTGFGENLIIRHKCKNNQYKIIEWNWRYLSKGKIIILIGKDKTEKLKLIEDKKKLEEIVNLEKFRTEYFTNMSHDLKTPLNIILTSVQVMLTNLENENLSEHYKKMVRHLNGVKQNSYRLLRLVNNIIDITKIDRGYYELKLGNYNIVSVIEDITLSVVDYMNNKNRKIIFDTTEEEIIVACDPEKIERIILNLLSNALKYTNENGVIEINIETDEENKNVIVHVKNDGELIPKEDCEKIFYRFKQSEKLLERRCEGSGIGLALVKSLIELHGGRIWVNTELAKGAEFIFAIPIKIVGNECEDNIQSKNISSKIEKCTIEFSEIYSI